MRASGSFSVKLQSQTIPGIPADPLMGQMSIDKQFSGALAATSSGTMISGGDFRAGSAVYCAIEHVTGTLDGKAGSFILQHTGIMDKNVPGLTITVAPGSGSGALTGITGSMAIRIETGGAHFYDFDYELPA